MTMAWCEPTMDYEPAALACGPAQQGHQATRCGLVVPHVMCNVDVTRPYMTATPCGKWYLPVAPEAPEHCTLLLNKENMQCASAPRGDSMYERLATTEQPSQPSESQQPRVPVPDGDSMYERLATTEQPWESDEPQQPSVHVDGTYRGLPGCPVVFPKRECLPGYIKNAAKAVKRCLVSIRPMFLLLGLSVASVGVDGLRVKGYLCVDTTAFPCTLR